MDPRGKRVLQVGSGWFDPVSGELSLDDRSTRLRPRTSALLAHLITHSDRIIGKDELLQAVWPNVVVTEDSLVQCVKEIRRALGADRHDWIRTVPREGYAFVPVFKDGPDKPSTRVEQPPWSRRHLAVAVVVIAFAVGAIVVAQLTRSDRATALPPLSVVVMPITNLTGNPARENAVDEMTERLAGSLSRFPDAFVIAPSTAFTFKGKTVDIRRVGSDLGVRYVLEGALRQQNAVLQLDLRLADSTNAVQLWSETFEVPVENSTELRHEVVARVAGSLGLRLISAEAQRSQRERNAPDAMNLVIRARAALRWSGQGEEGVEQARQLLEEAVRLEEGLAEAWALLAWTYLDEIRFRPGRDEALQRA
ncbi:MAG: winged helix-turn-helix domain-containing protein, partial [Burkholderiales bacterium]